jgi:RNA polymerase subunit RPABC4/transcription elongation factor Spt4
MNCNVCGRNLKEDSRYCDFCGTQVSYDIQTKSVPKTLDTKLLLKWIFISILITVAVAFIAKRIGLSIIFGGLFLPFFFKRGKKQ